MEMNLLVDDPILHELYMKLCLTVTVLKDSFITLMFKQTTIVFK